MMKKILIIFALTTLFAACTPVEYDSFATITGTVFDDASNEPIGQVLVTLSPGGLNTHTNSEGNFFFKELEAQQYAIILQKTGYKDTHRNIDAPSGETINVSISMQKQ